MNQTIHKDFEKIFKMHKYQDERFQFPTCDIDEFKEFFHQCKTIGNQNINFLKDTMNSLLSKYHQIHVVGHRLSYLEDLLSLLKDDIGYITFKFDNKNENPTLVLGLATGEFIFILTFITFECYSEVKHVDNILNDFIYPILDTSDTNERNLIAITTFHTSQVIKPNSLDELKNAITHGEIFIKRKEIDGICDFLKDNETLKDKWKKTNKD